MEKTAGPNRTTDLLTFWKEAYSNVRFSDETARKEQCRDLRRIDEAFSSMFDFDLHENSLEMEVSSLLFYRCHANWRSATILCASLQIAPSFALQRISLECVGYAACILTQPGLVSSWIHRDRDDFHRTKIRNSITTGKMLSSIAHYDRQLASYFKPILEKYIRLGAHPMSSSVLNALRFSQNRDGRVLYGFPSLADDGPHADECFRECVDVGLYSLIAFIKILKIDTTKYEAAREAVGFQDRLITLLASRYTTA